MGQKGSQRGYSRHRGVTHRAVQKALRDGRITAEPDGLIDFEKADAAWAANTDQAKPRNSVIGNPHMRREPGAPPGPGIGAGPPRAGNGPAAEGPGARGAVAYAVARAARESFDAKIRELEYRKLMGQLLDAEKVRVAWFNAARRARDLLLAIPDRVAPIIAGSSDPEEIQRVHETLSAELRRACEELSREPNT